MNVTPCFTMSYLVTLKIGWMHWICSTIKLICFSLNSTNRHDHWQCEQDVNPFRSILSWCLSILSANNNAPATVIRKCLCLCSFTLSLVFFRPFCVIVEKRAFRAIIHDPVSACYTTDQSEALLQSEAWNLSSRVRLLWPGDYWSIWLWKTDCHTIRSPPGVLHGWKKKNTKCSKKLNK